MKTPVKRIRSFRSFPLAFIGICLLFALLLLLNFRLFVTSGPSMEPTYTEGTVLLGCRTYGTPKAGQAVFLEYKGSFLLKRVAFLPGEDVSAAGYDGYWGSSIVPDGYVYVLGDNPDHSLDSRDPDFGLVAISEIWGKPLLQQNNTLSTKNLE